MFFNYPQEFKETNLGPGIVARMIWGERIMLMHVTLQPNSSSPRHSHFQEQSGIVIEGELTLTIGKETRVCKKGDAFNIPSNFEHAARTGDKLTIIIETFSPPREDYIKVVEAERRT